MSGVAVGTLSWKLASMQDDIERLFNNWDKRKNSERLWKQDASLWTGADEGRWLGWLDIVGAQRQQSAAVADVARLVRAAGFEKVLLLGMGGSSLGPEVLARTLGVQPNGLELLVLDSTVPQQVATFASKVDVRKTAFLVASKSGGTTEPNAFKQFFYEKVCAAVGADKAGGHFLAITDPGSSMEALATQENFLAIVHGLPTIGGRYSVLSPFGMLPAALLGIDTAAFLEHAQAMVDACGAKHAARDNAGVALGLILGGLARHGRDKVTFVTTPGLQSLGGWLEQLIAESSGKLGKGIVPVDGESLAAPERYEGDRVFVRLALRDEDHSKLDSQLDALHAAGHPVVCIEVPERLALGQEFFRWEIATAVACAVLELNAFNQPDVEAAKVATRRLTAAFEASGELPVEQPTLEAGALAIFAPGAHAQHLQQAATVQDALAAHLASLTNDDYFAINAYIEMDAAHGEILQAMRSGIRDTYKVATTVGFGPRFLHSTGQLHKGGPNNGVFLQLTAGEPQRLPVPGQKYSFGELVRFQAQGDLEVLVDRKRRVLRVHLGDDSLAGLQQLHAELDAALQAS